ncbi:MAG: ATP-binding protein [Lachnospiraceae bacterium]|nr:ATP-binding protein [Lachnospiraceae bacterium]
MKKRINFFSIIILVSLLISAGLIIFAVQNSKRVTNDNRLYLTDNTVKMAEVLDNEIVNGYDNIRILSELVSNSLTGPEFDIADIQHLIQNSVFDFMEFADKDGMDHNITGGVSDARDRQYYLDAKAGNSGMELIYISRATHETLLMFYAPVYYENEFVGSLVGVYQAANRITNLLTDKFFGEPATSYLADNTGRIIACSDGFDPQQEMYVTDLANGHAAMTAELENGMATGEMTAINIPGNDVGGCINKLPNSGYYMVRIFPQTANDSIVKRSNVLVFQLMALIIVIGAGFFIYLTKFFRNKQKELEEAKVSAEEAMFEAKEANAAKTSFLFNMSHDIRTPMNAIIGFRDLLEKNQEDPEKRQDYLDKIKNANEVLLSIINNVLEMSRIEHGKIALDEVAGSAEQFDDSISSMFTEMMAEKGITFTKEVSVEHQYVFCDPIKIRDVFINLLSNAYKYTNPGGSVHIKLEEIPCDKEGEVLFRTTVTDTGIGMSEDFLPHVFEEFAREQNTTDARIEGTGLGMPIVKRLVDFMNGTIEVTSQKGVGTTFTITLPHRLADKSDYVGQLDKSIDPELFKGKRILLAEDNDLNAEIATEILSEAGFVVERAADGKICCDMLAAAPPHHFDIILMDIQMPNMNGYDAASAIRAMEDPEKASVPIIAVTANAFEEDKRAAFKCGMNGHLSKPINVKGVMETIAMILRKREQN